MLHALLLSVALALSAAPVPATDDDRDAPAEHVESRHEAPEVPFGRPAILVGEVDTPRFRIVHTAAAKGAAVALSQDIERVRDLFSQTLGRDWPGTTELRIGVGRQEYEAIALPGGAPPTWSVALAYPAHHIVLLDALSLNEPSGNQTLRHELSHVALGQIGGSWPRWFQEGLAMRLTGEQYSVTHYTALFRAVTQDRVFHFEDLSEGWPESPSDVEVAYAQSVSFVDEVVSRYGTEKLSELLDAVGSGMRFETAFARVYRTSLSLEEAQWRKGLPRRYSWWPIAATSTTLLVVGALLTIIGFGFRKRQLRLHLEQMAAQEAAEDAAERLRLAEEAALEAQLQTIDLPASAESDVADPGKPTIH